MAHAVKSFWTLVAEMFDGSTMQTADGRAVFLFDKGYDPEKDPDFRRVRAGG